MSIQEHLDKIRNAIYGREVRESIAKGIETAYDDASEKDNANMEVKLARGTNPNLNTRLNKMDETDRQNTGKIDSNYNEVTAQLAQTDGRISEIIANAGDGTLPSEVIDMRTVNGKTYPVAGDALRAISEGEALKEGAVTTRETDFFNHSTNLYNRDSARPGFINTSGEVAESTNWSFTDPIKLEPGQVYSFRYIERFSFFGADGEYYGLRNSTTDDHNNGGKFTAREDYAYAIPNVINQYNESAQVNKGEELLPFEPYDVKLATRFLPELVAEGGSQKTKVKLELEHSGIDLDTGLITDATVRNWESTRRTGKFISVLPSSPISLNYNLGTAHLIEYDKNFNRIRTTSLSNSEEVLLASNTNFTKIMINSLSVNQNPDVELSFFKGSETDYIYNNRLDDGYINFVYEVYPSEGRDILVNDSTDEQYSTERYFNSGLLKLPPNYNPTGEPVKLIIHNPGANSFLNFEATHLGSTEYLNYWMNEGYAILGVYDWTTKYEGRGISFGSPISISARVQAYKWVTRNFNISENGVFVSGVSAGGYKTFNLAYNKGLPILAVAGLVPAIGPMQRPFGYIKEDRLAYADDFGFEGDTETVLGVEASYLSRTPELKEYIKLNAPKLVGYNGYWNGLIGIDIETLAQHAADYTETDPSIFENVSRVSTVPQKIWAAEDDTNVSFAAIKNYIQTLKNGQNVAELRLMPSGTGGHTSISSDPNALKVDTITTHLGIEHTNVPLAYVEVVQFFRRYEN